MTGTMTGTPPLDGRRERSRNGRERLDPFPQVRTRTLRERTGTGATGTERPPSLEGVPVPAETSTKGEER